VTCVSYVDLYVSMSVCEQQPHPNFTKVSVYVVGGHGSALLWQRCITLCTSGFVNDATFTIMGSVVQAMTVRYNVSDSPGAALISHRDIYSNCLTRGSTGPGEGTEFVVYKYN